MQKFSNINLLYIPCIKTRLPFIIDNTLNGLSRLSATPRAANNLLLCNKFVKSCSFVIISSCAFAASSLFSSVESRHIINDESEPPVIILFSFNDTEIW